MRLIFEIFMTLIAFTAIDLSAVHSFGFDNLGMKISEKLRASLISRGLEAMTLARRRFARKWNHMLPNGASSVVFGGGGKVWTSKSLKTTRNVPWEQQTRDDQSPLDFPGMLHVTLRCRYRFLKAFNLQLLRFGKPSQTVCLPKPRA